MSQNGHPERSLAVEALARDFPAGHRIGWHAHPTAQLVFAADGVMTVTTAAGAWVVPPDRAVWVPPRVPHAVAMTGAVRMRTLYLAPPLPAWIPSACRVVAVTPLAKALIRRLAEDGAGLGSGRRDRLVAVLADEIEALPTEPLRLPLPDHPALRRLAERLQADPACRAAAAELARAAGLTSRTLARRFRAETGMTFGRWRGRLALLAALPRLAAGQAVTTVALDLGYAGPSAFIAAFRRALGVTPRRYFREPDARTGLAAKSTRETAPVADVSAGS